jgi:hypothetical protein
LRRKVSSIKEIDAKQLSLDKVSAAVLVRASSRFVRRGIEQRDAAIRAGATGACTLVYRNRTYLMPLGEKDSTLDPKDSLAQILNDSFNPKDNDVIIITSASEKEIAENGTMAAALTLVA